MFFAFAALGLSTACTTNVEDDEKAKTAQYADQLTIIEADASIGKLVAAFQQNGRAVTFHLRQGNKIQWDLPPDPSARASYEIDARISDQEGRAMGTQMGGDGFVDPSWTMEGSKGVDPELRRKDFATAFAAVEAFVAWKAPMGLEQLRLGAIDAARRSNPALDVFEDVPTTDGSQLLPVEDGASLDAKAEKPSSASLIKVSGPGDPYANYDWTYSIYWDDLPGPVGEHSAVRLSLYRDGGTTALQWWASCNHGRCPDGDGMSRACTSSRINDPNDTRYFYSETSTSTGTSNGGCTNDYARVPIDSNHHNCHNDTRLQRYAIATGQVGAESRRGDYGSLCNQTDINAPKTCPVTF